MINEEKMDEQQLSIKFGDKIKEIRIRKGISQQDLGARCNICQSLSANQRVTRDRKEKRRGIFDFLRFSIQTWYKAPKL